MKIDNVNNNQNFGRLYINIKDEALKNRSVKKKLGRIQKIFTENGFSRKKNVDVLLGYNSYYKQFYGIISSKKQGIPNNPDFKIQIAPTKESIAQIKEWLDSWDYAYSPKGLKEWKNMISSGVSKMAEIRSKAKDSVAKRKETDSIRKSILI